MDSNNTNNNQIKQQQPVNVSITPSEQPHQPSLTPPNMPFLQDVTAQRNPFAQALQNKNEPVYQKHQHQADDNKPPSPHRARSSSSPASSDSAHSSQSNQQQQEKWQYQSIKQAQDNNTPAADKDNKQDLDRVYQIAPKHNDKQDKTSQIIRYKYCCKKCKHADRDKDKKACVCVVPRDQRRTHIGCDGCQTCGCMGCSREDFISRGEDPEYHPEDKKKEKETKKKEERFEARNGCCKSCMKAFSKSGKSCICQVPEDVRKTKLSTTGCKICGCVGCNPEDKKTSTQKPQKRVKRSRSRSERRRQKRDRSRSKEKKRRSRSRSPEIIDTFAMNFHNVDRSIIGSMIINEYQIDPALLGFGVPQRSSSYLLGKM